jgi:hypothetical protein
MTNSYCYRCGNPIGGETYVRRGEKICELCAIKHDSTALTEIDFKDVWFDERPDEKEE